MVDAILDAAVRNNLVLLEHQHDLRKCGDARDSLRRLANDVTGIGQDWTRLSVPLRGPR